MLRSLFVLLLALPLAVLAQTTTNARVNASDPTYTDNTTMPLSQSTSGQLRVTTGSSGSATFGAPASQSNTSSTITVGGTFQTIAASSATRKSFEFHNTCTKAGNCTTQSNNCYLFVAAAGVPSTSNSIIVPAGATYLRVSGAIPTNAIQATCDGTGDAYYLSLQ